MNDSSLEYIIVEGDSASVLQDIINNLIRMGWRPIGGVAVVRWQHERGAPQWNYTQAMTREHGQEKPNG